MSFKRLNTHNLELSDYLNQLFAGEKEEIEQALVAKDNTRVLSPVGINRESRGLTGISGRYIAMTLFLVPLIIAAVMIPEGGGDSLLVKKARQRRVLTLEKVETEQKILRPQVIQRVSAVQEGMINIDSIPSGARGTFVYGDVKREFTTPFAMNGLNIGQGIEGMVTLNRKGFKPVTDELILNGNEPVFDKTYPLESTAPGRLSVQARPWGYVYVPGVLSKRESPVHGVKINPGRYRVKVNYSPTGAWAVANINIVAGRSHRCLADFSLGSKMWCR